MGVLFLIIPLGVISSLIAFLFFESKAIRANKSTDSVEVELSKKFVSYNTSNNVLYFGITSYVLTLILAFSMHDPSYGLIHALLYIFGTTFVGSIVIFVLKIKRSILIKVFAAFLYGVPHMVAAGTAFLTSYLLS